jgi:selenocysteine lyase/cysteine desulfurase
MWTADHPRIGVFPFTLPTIPYATLAAALSAEFGIGLRHGCFCAHPLMAHLLDVAPGRATLLRHRIAKGEPAEIPGAVRASMGIGTTSAEIDALADALAILAMAGPQWTYQSSPDGDHCWPEPDPRPSWTTIRPNDRAVLLPIRG